MIPLQTFLGALLVEGVLFAVPLTALVVFHARERRDLYSRIMARDLTDYALNQRRPKPPAGRNLVREAIVRAAQETDED